MYKLEFVEQSSHTTFAYFYLDSAPFGYSLARRSKLYIACSDLFYKSERAHAAAPPFQIEPAALDFDLVLGAELRTAASIMLRCYNKKNHTVRCGSSCCWNSIRSQGTGDISSIRYCTSCDDICLRHMKERILYHACVASISYGNAVYHIGVSRCIIEKCNIL